MTKASLHMRSEITLPEIGRVIARLLEHCFWVLPHYFCEGESLVSLLEMLLYSLSWWIHATPNTLLILLNLTSHNHILNEKKIVFSGDLEYIYIYICLAMCSPKGKWLAKSLFLSNHQFDSYQIWIFLIIKDFCTFTKTDADKQWSGQISTRLFSTDVFYPWKLKINALEES